MNGNPKKKKKKKKKKRPVENQLFWPELARTPKKCVRASGHIANVKPWWWSPRQLHLHIPVRTGGIFYFPWHRHQIEGTNGF